MRAVSVIGSHLIGSAKAGFIFKYPPFDRFSCQRKSSESRRGLPRLLAGSETGADTDLRENYSACSRGTSGDASFGSPIR